MVKFKKSTIKECKQEVRNGWKCPKCGKTGKGKSNGLGGHLKYCNRILQVFPGDDFSAKDAKNITISDFDFEEMNIYDRFVCEIIKTFVNENEKEKDCLDLFLEDQI